MNRLTAKEAHEETKKNVLNSIESLLDVIYNDIQHNVSQMENAIRILEGDSETLYVSNRVIKDLCDNGYQADRRSFGDNPHWLISW